MEVYLISTFAPASSSFFFIVSESALETASFTVEGAPSTRSFASLRPRPVISRITLITVTFLSAGYSLRVHGELRLLLDRSGSGGARARGRCDGYGGRGGDAELLLHVGDELDDLEKGHLGNCIEDFVFVDSHVGSPENSSRNS